MVNPLFYSYVSHYQRVPPKNPSVSSSFLPRFTELQRYLRQRQRLAPRGAPRQRRAGHGTGAEPSLAEAEIPHPVAQAVAKWGKLTCSLWLKYIDVEKPSQCKNV